MNCQICGEPVILVPSAAERARNDRWGNTTAADYTALFPTHSSCFLAKRKRDTSELIRRYYPKETRDANH